MPLLLCALCPWVTSTVVCILHSKLNQYPVKQKPKKQRKYYSFSNQEIIFSNGKEIIFPSELKKKGWGSPLCCLFLSSVYRTRDSIDEVSDLSLTTLYPNSKHNLSKAHRQQKPAPGFEPQPTMLSSGPFSQYSAKIENQAFGNFNNNSICHKKLVFLELSPANHLPDFMILSLQFCSPYNWAMGDPFLREINRGIRRATLGKA